MPDGLTARIDRGSWPVLPIFKMMQRISGMEDEQIYNTFNMGIGMVFAIPQSQVETFIARARELGEDAHCIGCVEEIGADGERLVLR